MAVLNYISILFLLVASGSATLHQLKNRDAMIERTSHGPILLLLLSIAPVLMMMFNVIEIADLKWYWSLIIAFVLHFLTAVHLANIYHRIFGFKSKPFINFMLQIKDYRASLHYKDFILTFVMGILAYIVSRL